MTDVYALDLYHFTVVDRLFILIIIISVRVEIYKLLSILYRNHSIFRLDTHRDLTYLCAVTFKNNDYGKRKSKLPGGI